MLLDLKVQPSEDIIFIFKLCAILTKVPEKFL